MYYSHPKDEATIRNYYTNYIEGLKNPQKRMLELRGVREGVHPKELYSDVKYDNIDDFTKSKYNLNNPNLNDKINYIDLMDDVEKQRISSEFNTNLSKRERARKIIKRPVGNFFYKAINKGFDNYEYIGRYLIDDLFD